LDHPYTQDCLEYLAAAFPGRIELVPGDSTAVLPQLPAETFGFVHLDAGKEGTITVDLAAARRLVADDHVLAIDDTQNAALDAIVEAWVGRGELDTKSFSVANARGQHGRWRHKLARFAPRGSLAVRAREDVQHIHICSEAQHSSIYVTRGEDGEHPARHAFFAVR
jgi:hypothetical protein